ncbi:MAG: hypothetical protein JXR53_11340 [Bacteroidales bacterium]|nr:hypothetical protein [Bacteroidales bacterium]
MIAKSEEYNLTVGQFLSPDPFVQNSEFSQGYNRYSYCWNNPLKYTDPSGYGNVPTWAEEQAMNYTWGYSLTNYNGEWYNPYTLNGLLQEAKENFNNILNRATTGYNTYCISNSKENDDGSYSATLPGDRTNIFAGYSIGGKHIHTQKPLATDIINCILPDNKEYEIVVYDALGSNAFSTPFSFTL